MRYILFILLVASAALAEDDVIRESYGSVKAIDFHLWTTTSSDFKTDASFASGDCVITKDEGTPTNCTNLPVDEGAFYSWTPASGELNAQNVVVEIIDQGTKQWRDHALVVQTYGSSGAHHTDAATAFLAATISELSSMPSAASPSVSNILRWLYQYGMGIYKMTTSSSTKTLYKDDGSTSLGTCSVSDSGTLFTRGECS